MEHDVTKHFVTRDCAPQLIFLPNKLGSIVLTKII